MNINIKIKLPQKAVETNVLQWKKKKKKGSKHNQIYTTVTGMNTITFHELKLIEDSKIHFIKQKKNLIFIKTIKS